MLGMVAGELGPVRACGPGFGIACGWDREWRWTVGCLLEKVGTAKSPPSLLSPLGWHGELRLFTIDVIAQLTVRLVLGLVC
jgi:hypothetical protein